eukprot:scaffold54895_cov18-Tisochrysis_lutea.AAC.1
MAEGLPLSACRTCLAAVFLSQMAFRASLIRGARNRFRLIASALHSLDLPLDGPSTKAAPSPAYASQVYASAPFHTHTHVDTRSGHAQHTWPTFSAAQSLGSSRLPSPQQQHVRGGAAALTTSLLASVGPEGCVCMVSLEGSSLLGIVGATGKHQASKAPGLWGLLGITRPQGTGMNRSYCSYGTGQGKKGICGIRCGIRRIKGIVGAAGKHLAVRHQYDHTLHAGLESSCFPRLIALALTARPSPAPFVVCAVKLFATCGFLVLWCSCEVVYLVDVDLLSERYIDRGCVCGLVCAPKPKGHALSDVNDDAVSGPKELALNAANGAVNDHQSTRLQCRK